VPIQPWRSVLDQRVEDKYYYTETSFIYPKLANIGLQSIYQYRRGVLRENKSGVFPTLVATMGTGGHNVPIIRDDKGIRKITPRECFRLQGFPDTYELPCSDSHLYKQIGNSVSIKTIELIAEKIKTILDNESALVDQVSTLLSELSLTS